MFHCYNSLFIERILYLSIPRSPLFFRLYLPCYVWSVNKNVGPVTVSDGKVSQY